MAEKTYTVVAAYLDPPSLYCTTVQAPDPEAAVDAAWEQCKDDNNWDDSTPREDEWTGDTMVIAGTVNVVG